MGLETGRDVLRLYTTNFDYNLEFCIDTKHDNEPPGHLFQGRIHLLADDNEPSDNHKPQQMRNWVDTCITHKGCAKNHDGIYPTRLMDVGSRPGDLPRLVNTASELIDKEKYVFLSFRWGSAHFFMATSENFDRLRKGVPLHEFGELHQEAMSICRELGYRYIWIDALCIVHGPDSDLALEGSRIGGYIESADLVFIATNASMGEKLIQTRNPENLVSISAHVVGKSNESGTPFTLYLREPGQDAATVVRSQVLDRAWRFMEVLLARRMVIFHSNQLFWSCCENLRSEGSNFALPPLFETIPSFKHRLRQNSASTSYIRNEAFRYWHYLVELNSRGKLVHEIDRLPSVEFVMRSLYIILERENPDIEYWAGLWNQDLLRGLLWTSVKPYRVLSVRDQPQSSFPSWSWAHNNAPVSYSLASGLKNQGPGYGMLKDLGSALKTKEVEEPNIGIVKQSPHLLYVSALSRDISNQSPVIGQCDYLFDAAEINNRDQRYDKDQGHNFDGLTMLIVAPWTFQPSFTDSNSRWAGLLAKKQSNGIYVRRGVFLGPLCTEDMGGWERRELHIA
jgi:hypothetical protein